MKQPELITEEILNEWYGKRVLRRDFKLSNGSIANFYIFSAKTNPVIIFAVTNNNEVIAVRQFRHGANKFVLELPGGVMGEKEFPEETVKRELLAETGYMSKTSETFLLRNPVYFEPSSFTVAFWPFLVMGCRQIDEPALEETEIMETVLIPLDKWIEMILAGEICDSKTIAVTFLALRGLGFEVKPKSR